MAVAVNLAASMMRIPITETVELPAGSFGRELVRQVIAMVRVRTSFMIYEVEFVTAMTTRQSFPGRSGNITEEKGVERTSPNGTA